MGTNDLTVERVRELLNYDPTTGLFTNRVRRGGIEVGQALGWVGGNRSGYLYITLDGRKYRAHRLAWLYVRGVWPTEIDHKDGNGLNNAFANLREVTRAANIYNRRGFGRSGHKNISVLNRGTKRFQVQVCAAGKVAFQCAFVTLEEAIDAAAEARAKYQTHSTLS